MPLLIGWHARVILSCLTASVRLHLASISRFKGRLLRSGPHLPSYISCGCVLLICITTWSLIFSCHRKWSRIDIKADARWFYFLSLLWGWDYTCGFCVWCPLKSGALKPSREFRLLHVKIRSMCSVVSLPVLCTSLFVSLSVHACFSQSTKQIVLLNLYQYNDRVLQSGLHYYIMNYGKLHRPYLIKNKNKKKTLHCESLIFIWLSFASQPVHVQDRWWLLCEVIWSSLFPWRFCSKLSWVCPVFPFATLSYHSKKGSEHQW